MASYFTKLAQKPPLEVIMLLAIIKLQPHFQFVFAKTIIDIVQIRVPLIWKKISDHFPNWAKVVPWAKGQLGQIWANLVKK